MMPLERIVQRLQTAVPDAGLEIIANPAVSDQPSLRVDRAHALDVALAMRDDAELRFDTVSNVTGVDWLDSVEKERVEVLRLVDGVEKTFEDFIEIRHPGRLEAVYHLYSIARRHGPLVLRMRTDNRTDLVTLPSLTPIWRGCELQEREIYDLYGIQFEGHPDLRRLLMWPEFQDHPMRKDYVDPDDYEYEPTPHDAVLKRSRERQATQSAGGTP
jgi:NADH-quinone oxidoreductase subunit C